MKRSTLRSLSVLFVGALAPLTAVAKDSQPGCPPSGDIGPGDARVDDCTVRISQSPDGACHASVIGTGGVPIFEETGPAFVLEPVSGKDIDGTGGKEAILRTRGKERDFGYRIVTCGVAASTVISFENGFPARFEATSRGRVVIALPDDGFRDFPDMPPHDLSGEYAPDVRLFVEEGVLVDVGHEYRARSDKAIQDLHALLTGPDLRKFRAGKIDNDDERRVIAARIIKIVASHLASGREEKAWKELERDWPPGDYERIHQAILAARAHGTAARLGAKSPS